MTALPAALDAHIALIRDVPDFPRKGILFKDITPLLQHGPALKAAIDGLVKLTSDLHADVVVGIESRGFLFASPLAYATGSGVALVRKPGKLPANCVRQEYALEYGTDLIEMHADAITPGQRVLIVDDVLATGGTARATADLVKSVGGVIAGYAFLIELDFLKGHERLGEAPVRALLHY
jgi:adenine phosphoribosyltransferase